MNDNFQKTVNLRDKMKKKSPQKIGARAVREEAPVKKKRPSRAQAIDQVYSEAPEEKIQNEFQQIERAPSASLGQTGMYKLFTTILGLVLVATIAYFIYVAPGNNEVKNQGEQITRWYAVELVNGETYYGQITDTSADPVIINKVYYNYDQLNSGEGESGKNESGNLRLIKRGKETHGPAGEMSVVRAQVLFMEALKDDSMVLKAILDYEK